MNWISFAIFLFFGKISCIPLQENQLEKDEKKSKIDFENENEYSAIDSNDGKSLLSEYLQNIVALEGTTEPPPPPPQEQQKLPPQHFEQWPSSPVLDSYPISNSLPQQSPVNLPKVPQQLQANLPEVPLLPPQAKPLRRRRRTTTTTTPQPRYEAQEEILPPQRKLETPEAGIEDAILAALEQANTGQITTPKPKPLRSKRPPTRTGTGMKAAFANQPAEVNRVAAVVPSTGGQPQYVVVPINQQGLVNGQILQLAAVDGETTTGEPAPGEFIAGLFGGLGQGNLAVIAENTFKLLASSGVQNFFVGFADQVTCQLSPECIKKQKDPSAKN